MTPTHHNWVVGDLQGCIESLEHLLEQPDLLDDPTAQIYFAGDLINRGPASLAVLRRIQSLGARAHCVLGNHDVHFLSVAAGMRRPTRYDTFDDILSSPEKDYWVDWLRHQPLYRLQAGHLIVHAGVCPEWSLDELCEVADEIHSLLRSDDWAQHLPKLFGNEPALWSPKLTGYDRLRYGLNAITRIRYLHQDGSLDFSHKSAPDSAPDHLRPWFTVKPRGIAEPIVFGHWSTLGFLHRYGVVAVDTGALWGGKLTALRLEDYKTIQVPAQEAQPLSPI